MSNGKKFNLDEFVSKGDAIYQQEMTGAPVYSDPKFPGIARFDDKEQETDEYILRGLTGGEVIRGPGHSYTYSGMRGSEPVKGKSTIGDDTMTPRQAYFMKQYIKHTDEAGMTKNERQKYGAEISQIKNTYGQQPRYSQGKIISPYSIMGIKSKAMEGLPRSEQLMQEMDFHKRIKNLPTSLTTEDKIMNSMKDDSLDIRGLKPQSMEDRRKAAMDRARNRMKSRKKESNADKLRRLRNMKFGDD